MAATRKNEGMDPELSTELRAALGFVAVTWGCASSAQSHAILDKMDALGLADPVPTKPVNFACPRDKIAIEARLALAGWLARHRS